MTNPRTKPKFCNKNVATGSAWRVSLCIRSGSCVEEKKNKNYINVIAEDELWKRALEVAECNYPLRENGYKLWVQWFLGSLGQTSVNDCSMVYKTTINQSHAMPCHPKDLRNRCAKACTHSLYNFLELEIRGYTREVSMATWWARTTPVNHWSCAIKMKGSQWKTTYWPKNGCRVCHEKLFCVSCMITTDGNLTENLTIPDITETPSNKTLW